MEGCLKCGIIVEPPTFVVIYKSEQKFRKKTMPLRQFKTDSNCKFLAQELKQRHQLGLPQLKIEKMLRILQEMMKGTRKNNALKIVGQEFEEKSHGNLNKMTKQELELQKEEMDVLFTRNQVKKDEPDFEYDKQVEFGDQQGDSPWDADTDHNEDFWET